MRVCVAKFGFHLSIQGHIGSLIIKIFKRETIMEYEMRDNVTVICVINLP